MHIINEIIFWIACGVLWIILSFWLGSHVGKFLKRNDEARRKAFSEYVEEMDKLSERKVLNG